MTSKIYYSNIQLSLFRYADLVEQSNSLGLSDDAIDAENFFCAFLNKAFKWNLTNANEIKKNQDSFDLIDNHNKIAVQVTSNKNHTAKFNKTIATFKKNKANKKLKHFIVLFISKKCPQKILKEASVDSLVYEAYDIPKLLSKVYFKNKLASELRGLNQILEDVTAPVLINSSFPVLEKPDSRENIPVQIPTIKKSGLYLERSLLTDQLFSFSQIANGLVVGGPGVGKSFTIEELQKLYHKKKIPCFLIRINELLEGSDEEIKRELKTNIYWLNGLKKISFDHLNWKALLIFDAFDTAKDERLKSIILKQIQNAIKQLNTNWNILVSVRTFDAAKSTRLLELFPQVNVAKAVSCRYFEIPELSENELDAVTNKNKKLGAIILKSTAQLKKLLKVPYFLKLLEKIINDGQRLKAGDIVHIETEEQLLEVFWNKKVADNTNKDLFLRKLTQVLAINENLSCPKANIITELNSSVFDNLVSLEVIAESSVTKQNISFNHNILLEFAIAKYLIPDEAATLIEYVNINQKMPFHFRQSFIYFYSKIWKQDNPLFWKHYFEIRAVNSPLFRLYHQTILNYILAGFYNNTKELVPIFELANIEERSHVIKKILEGIRFISKGKLRNKDFILLHKVSEYMHESFLWELGFLTDQAIEFLNKEGDKKNIKILSKAAINYLEFVLAERKTSKNKYLIDVNGGNWGIRNLCATFPLKMPTAVKLIKQTLQILKEPDFPIRFFYLLSDNVIAIFNHDRALALQIYETLYYHTEDSNKETNLGNSAIMSLRSNRRQDFETIHYKLEKDYKILLDIAPAMVIPLGLEIVEKFAHNKKYQRPAEKPFRFIIYGIKAKLLPDFSFYESSYDKDYGPNSHLENILKFLEEKLKTGEKALAVSLLKTIIGNAEISSIWRRLLKLFALYPNQLLDEAFEILLHIPIYICNETVYEAGELIKKLWPFLLIKQKRQIENIILSIRSTKLLKKEPGLGERRVSRLLSCIPSDQITNDDAKKFIETTGLKENLPLISQSGLQPHQSSRAEKMRNLGIDPNDKFETTLYKILEKIESFTTKYDYNSNDKPNKEEYAKTLELVKKLFGINQTHNFSNTKLKFNCDYEVSRYAKLLAVHNKKLSKSLRSLIQKIALFYIHSNDYKSIAYEKGDIKDRWGAYAPTPRTEAAQILLHLLFTDKSGIIASVILELAGDNTSIIRFKALRDFTYFWHFRKPDFWSKLKERSRVENDGMCLHELINCICFDNILKSNQEEAEEIAQALIANLLENTTDHSAHEVWHIYVVLILKLKIKYNSSEADSIIYKNLHVNEFVRQLLFETLAVIDPHGPGNNYRTNPGKYQSLFKLIKDIVANRFNSIKSKGLGSSAIQNDFEIIDTCIQHLYFTIQNGKKNNNGKKLDDANKIAFFEVIKPLLSFIVDESATIETGFMVVHTGYYFMQLLNHLLFTNPEYVLTIASSIVKSAAANGFTYDHSTLGEVVKFTEKILADHKALLSNKAHFNSLITILDLFANSGWQEALELTWRLKEVF